MINIYENIRTKNGAFINGRTHFFIKKARDDGEILESVSGQTIVPEGPGTLFVVDEWLIPQIDKLLFIDGILQVKEGEKIDEPVKSEIDLQEEELLRQLAELRAQRLY